MANNTCAQPPELYQGDGSTTKYSFAFPYIETSDIAVYLWNETTETFDLCTQVSNSGSCSGSTTEYYFTSATPVDLTFCVAPGLPPTDRPDDFSNVIIIRQTDICQMVAYFYPGSPVRAQDLNNNFTQVLLALQDVEGRLYQFIEDYTGFVRVTGDTMTGGPLDMNDFQLTGVPYPILDADAANKYYVDEKFGGNTEVTAYAYAYYTATQGDTVLESGVNGVPGFAISIGLEQIYINGALQQKEIDYIADSTTKITVTQPLLEGDVVGIYCINNIPIATAGQAENVNYTYPGGVQQTVQARLEQYVSVKDFGAKGDGVTDDTSAIQAALDTLPGSVFVPSGNYKISSSINIKGNTSLVGAGKEETKFTVDPSATAFNTNTRAWVSKAGSAPTAIPSLSTNYGKSAWSITFTGNHGLVAGDLILFMGTVAGGFNGFRSYYFKGEYNTVQEVVSPTEIYLTHATLDTYDTADTEMYKCSYTGGSLKDFSVIGNGYSSTKELALKNTQGCSVESVYVTGSTNACMSVIQSYDTDIKKTTCFQNEPAGGTSYGLSIANSQLTRIQGRFKAARHAVAHGGDIEFGIPCRYSVTYNSFLETDILGNAPAWDCHGNSEYITLTDSFLTGGISVGGNHSLVSGCQITSGQVQASSICQYAELNGLDHILTDCYIYSGYNNPNFGVIDFGGNSLAFNANTVEGGTISITNCVLDFPAHTGFGIEIRNRGSLTDYNIVVDNVDVRMPNQVASLAAVYVATVSGNTPRSIQVTRVTPGPINNQPLYIDTAEINTPIRQDSVSGIDTFSIGTGDTYSIDSPQSLPFKYARKPSMLVSGESLYDSTGTNWVVQNYSNYPNSSQYRITLRSTGGGASSAFAPKIHWTASLQDF